MLVGAPAYLAENGEPGRPLELKKHRLIAFGFWRETEKRWILSNKKKSETVAFEPALSFNDYAAIRRAVVLGQGIAEVPSILCGEALRKNAIVEIMPDWKFQSINLQAVHTGTRNMARLTRLFLDTCSEHIGSFVDQRQ